MQPRSGRRLDQICHGTIRLQAAYWGTAAGGPLRVAEETIRTSTGQDSHYHCDRNVTRLEKRQKRKDVNSDWYEATLSLVGVSSYPHKGSSRVTQANAPRQHHGLTEGKLSIDCAFRCGRKRFYNAPLKQGRAITELGVCVCVCVISRLSWSRSSVTQCAPMLLCLLTTLSTPDRHGKKKNL